MHMNKRVLSCKEAKPFMVLYTFKFLKLVTGVSSFVAPLPLRMSETACPSSFKLFRKVLTPITNLALSYSQMQGWK